MIKNLIFSCLCLTAIPVLAQDAATEQAKAVMDNVYNAYVHIIPYAYSSGEKTQELKDKKKKEELIKNLHELGNAFKSAKHAELFQRPGFRPSLDTINDHLDATILSVESNSLMFAQKRLNVLGTLCVSCHSQIPQEVAKSAFGKNIAHEKRESFESDFAYANYLYLIRNFDDSRKYYEKAISAELDKRTMPYKKEVMSSLKKILSMYTKVNYDFDHAKSFIDQWKKDNRLSKEDLKTVNRWSADLAKWKDYNPAKDTNVSALIQKRLAPLDMKKEVVFSGEDDVTFLIMNGILSNYLVKNPEGELAPEALYWISMGERRMDQTYFYSLSELYLKDCIKRFPSSPYAKKCFMEYSDSVESGFTGSAGTDIPPDVKKELQKLKALIKN